MTCISYFQYPANICQTKPRFALLVHVCPDFAELLACKNLVFHTCLFFSPQITQINKIIFSVSVVWLIINCSNLCNLWCTSLITEAKVRSRDGKNLPRGWGGGAGRLNGFRCNRIRLHGRAILCLLDYAYIFTYYAI